MTHNRIHTSSEVTDTVLRMFGTELDTEVRPHDAISDLSAIDSVKLMRLVTDLEDHYRISLDDDAVFTVTTVGDLIDLVSTTLDSQP
ncbi:acyl carrier protein [Nocardia tenerifensis]|uniref:Acyl carrier protein n=1 Tax=Nocardia tenerifensis TaxID=228006 RepID=A0A318JWU4_9NOCA|nr:acyl carrier protein [Nocardia tenerifensis]PXX58106.1 acyl carrier protein [Nocardia tenerifensis]